MKDDKCKANQTNTDDNDKANKPQTSGEVNSDQLPNEEGKTVEKRGRGRPKGNTLAGKKETHRDHNRLECYR